MIKTSDIYNITKFVNDIQKKFIEDETEETLSMGIFGYLNEFNSTAIQNAIINAAEWGNEAIPTRSKFERTILTNAVTYNIEDINAIPGKMQVMIGFIKNEIDEFLDEGKFIFDKNIPIYVEDYEFHLDYDMMIARTKLQDGGYTYSAKYIMDRINPISEIINPYLPSPFMINIDNSKFMFITLTLRQVELDTQYKKIISNNILENKTFEFKFNDQLASFEILVEEEGKTKYITPIFEGMSPEGDKDYCFYTYIDANTIRVKFDRKAYEPKLNANITIYIKTTRGTKGNFRYKDDIILSLESNRFNYKNLSTLIRPVSDSTMGIDRKSITELKEMIPKEILSKGNIINNKDLENFFNMIDDNNKIYLFRKRDNQIERMYYAYLIAKNNIDNIVPTNTIHVNVREDEFDTISDQRYIINPGRPIVLKSGDQFGKLDLKRPLAEEEKESFVYASPFIIVVNKNPLSASYYLTTMNRSYNFAYSYINNNSDLQFIAHRLNIYKNYIEENDYRLTTTILQNININRGLVDIDDNGNVTKSKIKPVLIIEQSGYKYYTIGEITGVDLKTYAYDVEFKLKTDNLIDRDNKINILNLSQNGSDNEVNVYCDEKVTMHIAVYVPSEFSVFELDDFIKIPQLKGYSCTNRYSAMEPINLFYNYSQVMNSIVLLDGKIRENHLFTIKGVPLVKYSYLNDVDRCNELIEFIQYRKAYIDTALSVLENSFNIDFKFFNTYGPSQTFTIGHQKEGLDKVNISIKFKIKTVPGYDKNIKTYITRDIKAYMENINNLTDCHMSNLTAYIKNKYKSDLEFIEFIGINDYDSTFQYIEREEMEVIEQVPEFLTINLGNNVDPDIEIESL